MYVCMYVCMHCYTIHPIVMKFSHNLESQGESNIEKIFLKSVTKWAERSGWASGNYIYMYVRMYVCMYVCVCACMCVCVCVYVCTSGDTRRCPGFLEVFLMFVSFSPVSFPTCFPTPVRFPVFGRFPAAGRFPAPVAFPLPVVFPFPVAVPFPLTFALPFPLTLAFPFPLAVRSGSLSRFYNRQTNPQTFIYIYIYIVLANLFYVL